MDLLAKKIRCEKFLSLVKKSLKAGYKDPETQAILKPNIGTPQGSVLSPLLANIVLHELDEYVTTHIIPNYTKGRRRRTNPEYNKLAVLRDPRKKYYQSSTPEERAEALKAMRSIPRNDPKDPNFRRSMYLRYADDFVILLEGPKAECFTIKEHIKSFLREKTGLELNDEKTVITNVNDGFDFLGANVKSIKNLGANAHRMSTRSKSGQPITMRSSVRARVNMPTAKLIEKLIKAGFASRDSKRNVIARAMTGMVNMDHYTILQFYQSKINGLLSHFSYAGNRSELSNLF